MDFFLLAQETVVRSPDAINQTLSTIGAAGLAVHLMEFLKRKEWLGLSKYTPAMVKAYSVFVAAASNVGITAAFTVDPSTQHGIYTISGLPTTESGWLSMILSIAGSYAWQKLYYETAIKPDSPRT